MTLNGEPCAWEPGMTVADLLKRQGLEKGRVAVERNGEIVPRASYAQTPLNEEDKLEVVGFVGGG